MLSLPLHLESCQQFRLSVLEPRDRAYHRSHSWCPYCLLLEGRLRHDRHTLPFIPQACDLIIFWGQLSLDDKRAASVTRPVPLIPIWF